MNYNETECPGVIDNIILDLREKRIILEEKLKKLEQRANFASYTDDSEPEIKEIMNEFDKCSAAINNNKKAERMLNIRKCYSFSGMSHSLWGEKDDPYQYGDVYKTIPYVPDDDNAPSILAYYISNGKRSGNDLAFDINDIWRELYVEVLDSETHFVETEECCSVSDVIRRFQEVFTKQKVIDELNCLLDAGAFDKLNKEQKVLYVKAQQGKLDNEVKKMFRNCCAYAEKTIRDSTIDTTNSDCNSFKNIKRRVIDPLVVVFRILPEKYKDEKNTLEVKSAMKVVGKYMKEKRPDKKCVAPQV